MTRHAETSTAPKPGLPATRAVGDWREQLRDAVRDPDQLIDLLDLPDDLRDGARRAALSFPLVVPHSFLARMRRGDRDDPLLRQVLPIEAEGAPVPTSYSEDPGGESGAIRAAGLLQKYRGRALLRSAYPRRRSLTVDM